jgi:hypothetical protein
MSFRGFLSQSTLPSLVIFGLILALALRAAQAFAGTLTCEVSGAGKAAHCFDHHGYLSTEERSGDYVRGHDNQGDAWTEWRRINRTYVWPGPDRQ